MHEFNECQLSSNQINIRCTNWLVPGGLLYEYQLESFIFMHQIDKINHFYYMYFVKNNSTNNSKKKSDV